MAKSTLSLERVQPLEMITTEPLRSSDSTSSSTISCKDYRHAFDLVNGNGKSDNNVTAEATHERTAITTTKYSFESWDIPTDCIPLMASTEQVLEFEANLRGRFDYRLLTVEEGLYMFSEYEAKMQPQLDGKHFTKSAVTAKAISRNGKLFFLTQFVLEIIARNVNFDFALLCSSDESERALRATLATCEIHFRRMSEVLDTSGIHGVVIKIRKNGKIPSTTFKPNVDMVMFYDSAIRPSSKILSKFRGAVYAEPEVVYLSCIDTADIRMNIYSKKNKRVSWTTEFEHLDEYTKQHVLFQENRKPNISDFKTWNLFAVNDLVNWVVKKSDKRYAFQYSALPSEHMSAFLKFPSHHPLPNNFTLKKSSCTTAITMDDILQDDQNRKQVESSSTREDSHLSKQREPSYSLPSPVPSEEPEPVEKKRKRESPSVSPSSKVQKQAIPSTAVDAPISKDTSEPLREPNESKKAVTDPFDFQLDFDTSSSALPTVETTIIKNDDDDKPTAMSDYSSLFCNALEEFEKQMNDLTNTITL